MLISNQIRFRRHPATRLSVIGLFAVSSVCVTPLSAAALEHHEAVEKIDLSAMPAGRYNFDHPHAHIYWTVSHSGYSNTHGLFSDFDGVLTLDPENPARSEFEIVIDMTSVDTDVPGLDADLVSKNFFDAERYPEARFVMTGLESGGVNDGVMSGDLTIRGVTKPIELNVRLNGVNPNPKDAKWTRMGYTATTSIDRMDFGIDRFPDIIGHEIDLTIDMEFLLDVGEND